MHEDRRRIVQTTQHAHRQPQRRAPVPAYDGILDALPPKIRNALLGAGITSLAQADALLNAALARIRWIGPETVRYLRALACHAPIAHHPMQVRDAEELRRYALAIAGEIARGRLASRPHSADDPRPDDDGRAGRALGGSGTLHRRRPQSRAGAVPHAALGDARRRISCSLRGPDRSAARDGALSL